MGAPPQIMLGSLGMADSLILMVLALVVFGPRRLPQIGRQIGKLMYEFRKASNDFKFQMEEELRLAEEADRRKKEEEECARNLALNAPTQTIEAQAAIGAVEQVSVSAPTPVRSSESSDCAQNLTPGPDAAPLGVETDSRFPLINPPSTGAPIAAARPNGLTSAPEVSAESNPPDAAEATNPVEGTVTAEANIGAEPAPTAEHTRNEAISQHG